LYLVVTLIKWSHVSSILNILNNYKRYFSHKTSFWKTIDVIHDFIKYRRTYLYLMYDVSRKAIKCVVRIIHTRGNRNHYKNTMRLVHILKRHIFDNCGRCSLKYIMVFIEMACRPLLNTNIYEQKTQ